MPTPDFTPGDRIIMRHAHGSRTGHVQAEVRPDQFPTGAVFIPVQWDDGTTDNVDSRVLHHTEDHR